MFKFFKRLFCNHSFVITRTVYAFDKFLFIGGFYKEAYVYANSIEELSSKCLKCGKERKLTYFLCDSQKIYQKHEVNLNDVYGLAFSENIKFKGLVRSVEKYKG